MILRRVDQWMIDELEFASAVTPIQIRQHRGDVGRGRADDLPGGFGETFRLLIESKSLEDLRVLGTEPIHEVPCLLAFEEFAVAATEDRGERIDHRVHPDLEPLVGANFGRPSDQESGGHQSSEIIGHRRTRRAYATSLVADPEWFARGLDHGVIRRPKRGKPRVDHIQRQDVGRKIARPTETNAVLEEVHPRPGGERRAPGIEYFRHRKSLGRDDQPLDTLVGRPGSSRTPPFGGRIWGMLEGQCPWVGPSRPTGQADRLAASMEPVGQGHPDRTVANDLPTGECVRLLHI